MHKYIAKIIEEMKITINIYNNEDDIFVKKLT